MSYISRHTGKEITEIEHVRESISDILTTRKQSRVMLMEYGSDLWQLIDRPVSRELLSDIKMEIATAIDRWEPRVRITQVSLDLTQVNDGIVLVDLLCVYLPTGEVLNLQAVELVYKNIE